MYGGKRGITDVVIDMVPTSSGIASILALGSAFLFAFYFLALKYGLEKPGGFYFALITFMAISVFTRFPDRFRPALSFKVGMGLTILVTIYGGVFYGLIFSIVTVIIEALACFEFPQQTPVTFLTRIVFCVVLPSMYPYAGGSMVLYILQFIIPQYIVTTPLRIVLGERPPFFQLQYALFNTIWHMWFFWIFGAQLVGMIAV
ncbi:MAG: hypothetical protein ABH829_04510 [archaeon]